MKASLPLMFSMDQTPFPKILHNLLQQYFHPECPNQGHWKALACLSIFTNELKKSEKILKKFAENSPNLLTALPNLKQNKTNLLRLPYPSSCVGQWNHITMLLAQYWDSISFDECEDFQKAFNPSQNLRWTLFSCKKVKIKNLIVKN